MRLLDLFCGAGGTAMGYAQAGFKEIVGVDLTPQPNYPFTFVQGDALRYGAQHGHEFDAIHASPPCQRYSTMTRRWAREGDHADLVAPTRDLLVAIGRPWVIENVPTAPLVDPVMLCGSMFGLGATVAGEWRQLRRHRKWEASVPLVAPQACRHAGTTIRVYGHPGGSSRRDGITFASFANWQEAMGIDWMSIDETAQAIPPAYARWVGQYLAAAVVPVPD